MSDPVVTLPAAFKELAKPARYKAYYGGRGSAKSHSFAAQLLIDGINEPLRILCTREVQRSIKDSVKRLLDDKIKAHELHGHYQSLDTEVRGANGTLFIFAGLGNMTIDQIKSMEGVDRCWIEEGQTISKRSLEVLIPTIRKDGSEIWASWNPRNQSDPIDQRFRGEITPEDAIIRSVSYKDNPFFTGPLEAERAFDEANNPDRYAHIWLGEYEPMIVGAIWTRQVLADHRRTDAPEMDRIVVSVDPAVTSGETANEHGIIVAGTGADGRGYVIDDLSCGGNPQQWATRVIAGFDRYEADAIVIEVNQGGDMVRHTLNSVRPGLPIVEVRATRGKHVRAEPISALYSIGRISHCGTFDKLETQMCAMTPAGYEGTDDSPDRCDALVWAFTHLFPKAVVKKKRTRARYVEARTEQGWMG